MDNIEWEGREPKDALRKDRWLRQKLLRGATKDRGEGTPFDS